MVIKSSLAEEFKSLYDNMKQLMWNLQYLCIEALSKNIHRYSRIPEENWNLMHCKGIGDKLLTASLANSHADSFKVMDEIAFNFILSNFCCEKFKILIGMSENIKYFDFLNGRHFEELDVYLGKELMLRNEQDIFKLTTNVLCLNEFYNDRSFVNSRYFFSNLYVNKELKILYLRENEQNKREAEELLLVVLRNTSKNIERIQIPFENPTEQFIERFVEILKDRKMLKNLDIKFTEELFKPIGVHLLRTSFTGKSVAALKYLKSVKNTKILDENLLMVNNIENLNINFDKKVSDDKIREFFSFLNAIRFDSLLILRIYLKGYYDIRRDLYDILSRCPKLEHLSVSRAYDFDSILPVVKSLKVLVWKHFKMDSQMKMYNFRNFISKCCLQEINLFCVDFQEDYFLEFVLSLEMLQNSLTLFSMIYCDVSEENLKYLPRSLKKFTKLITFHINHSYVPTETFLDILESLRTSSQTLESIHFDNDRNEINLNDCSILFDFLMQCEKLSTIYLSISIYEEKIPDLLLVLKNFGSILKVINLQFCYDKKYLENLTDFLSECSRLEYVYLFTLEKSDVSDIVDSLKNSRYSLCLLTETTKFAFSGFPNLF